MAEQSSQSLDSPLAGAITCERRLSFTWTPLVAAPEAGDLDRWNDDNLRVLSAVALLDETRQSAPNGDDQNSLEGEVARLHQKVNLILDLLTLLIAKQAPLAPERRVLLSWKGLAWDEATAPSVAGLIDVRLHRSVPQSFVWPARIVSAAEGLVQARFEAMREPLQTALERYVFLHHRRAIAGHRRGS
jgi:hypothetical protein